MSSVIQPPASPKSSALNAFLQGIEPRAWVFAGSQCGSPECADRILEAGVRQFAGRARSLPLALWPIQFWNCLLAHPQMLAEFDPGRDLATLGSGPRAALLLRLIAGLDFSHAAEVLGVSIEAYEDALKLALAHPDLDDAWMQELREHLHALIHQMPIEQRQQLVALRERALAAQPETAVAAELPAFASPAQKPRWLVPVLASLVLVLAVAVIWPFNSSIAPGQSEPLPIEAVAPPPQLTDSVIVTHPDYLQLSEPVDDALAQQLGLLSWVAASTPSAVVAPVAEVPATPPALLEQLPVGERTLLQSAYAAWPALDAATRAALLHNAHDWHSRTTTQRAALRERVARWDRQAAPDRARLRTPFQSWLELSSSDRQRLRVAAEQVAALPVVEQTLLRERFAALPTDVQRLWWLGPAMGQELIPIAPLFAFMPEAERPELLTALRTLDAQSRSNLALLAPRLSEAQRQALRRQLLAATPEQRAALISRRLVQ